MKVLWPFVRLSEAPTLVKIRSVRQIFAESAGTYEPMCARSVMRATCLR